MSTVIAIILMLISSAMYALSYVLQHKGTQQSIGSGVTGPDGKEPGPLQLVKNRFWLYGVILFCVSFLFHIGALAFGSVAVVQPLLVTELIFIPPFAYLISKTKITSREWIAIVVLAVSLAVFLVVAHPHHGDETPSAMGWLITIVVFYVGAFVLMAIGNRLGVTHKAALYGTATGAIGALMALTANAAFGEHDTVAHIVKDPLTWIMWLIAISTIILTAMAFRAGPITASSPAIIVANPVVASIAAIILFGDSINSQWWALLIIAICLVAIGWGIVTLSGAVHADEEVEAT